MLVEENGKSYEIDPDTKTVKEAKIIIEQPEVEAIGKGSRVGAEGRHGNVISKSSSVYGEVFGVQFDDGETEEFLEENLSHSNEVAPKNETNLEEVVSRFEAYKDMPLYTRDELDSKLAEGRWLNLRAKSMLTDNRIKLASSEQMALDNVVVITGADQMDVQDAVVRLESADREKDLEGTRYHIATSDGYAPVMGLGSNVNSDWLEEILDTDLGETTDADLASRAAEIVSGFGDRLEDESFKADVLSLQADQLGLDQGQQKRLANYVSSEQGGSKPKLAKTASVEENLDDFDTSALFV